MAWPEDPYGSGQTRRAKPRLLTALFSCCADDGIGPVPVAYAVVYLRLHRTRAIDASAGLSFGFRAAAVLTFDECSELVRLADLDVLRARRLAHVLVGHCFDSDLDALQGGTAGVRTGPLRGDNEFGRGLRALATEWPLRGTRSAGQTIYVDLGRDLNPTMPRGPVEHHGRALHLRRHARAAGLALPHNTPSTEPHPLLSGSTCAVQARRQLYEQRERRAACAVEQALACALIAARHLRLYDWRGELDMAALLEANVADCFPTQRFRATASQ